MVWYFYTFQSDGLIFLFDIFIFSPFVGLIFYSGFATLHNLLPPTSHNHHCHGIFGILGSWKYDPKIRIIMTMVINHHHTFKSIWSIKPVWWIRRWASDPVENKLVTSFQRRCGSRVRNDRNPIFWWIFGITPNGLWLPPPRCPRPCFERLCCTFCPKRYRDRITPLGFFLKFIKRDSGPL